MKIKNGESGEILSSIATLLFIHKKVDLWAGAVRFWFGK
jgi:hypothetical protein